ncbi:hypothetical protein MNBD_GAMMA11-84 [hydrothermal vent metagenome]|uniref:Uncharacterized protein n=1 Tax=hydrothermal vent metagenome TaxID=652676 RepID=A0A3B0WVL3_9ZZZZ
MPIEVNNLTINTGLSADDKNLSGSSAESSDDYREDMEILKSEIMQECQHLIRDGLKAIRER